MYVCMYVGWQNICSHDIFLIRNMNWLPFASTWAHFWVFGTVDDAYHFSSPAWQFAFAINYRASSFVCRLSFANFKNFNLLRWNCMGKWTESTDKCFTNPTLHERETLMIGWFLNIVRSIKVWEVNLLLGVMTICLSRTTYLPVNYFFTELAIIN